MHLRSRRAEGVKRNSGSSNTLRLHVVKFRSNTACQAGRAWRAGSENAKYIIRPGTSRGFPASALILPVILAHSFSFTPDRRRNGGRANVLAETPGQARYRRIEGRPQVSAAARRPVDPCVFKRTKPCGGGHGFVLRGSKVTDITEALPVPSGSLLVSPLIMPLGQRSCH
mgnify:CR=1 FL=1